VRLERVERLPVVSIKHVRAMEYAYPGSLVVFQSRDLHRFFSICPTDSPFSIRRGKKDCVASLVILA